MVLLKKQTYTATTNIKFLNSDASNGYAYDGTLISKDIEEITDTEVLESAIQKVGIGEKITANKLAKEISVEKVIPDDEQKKIDAALDNGHTDYEYYPIEYKISIESDLPEAGKILNAVVGCYITYYSENHISKDSFPSDISQVLSEGNSYDYIEQADLVRENIEKMTSYLSSMDSVANNYRNAINGYSFGDLKELYQYTYDTMLPELYATILTNKATKNPELLLQKLEQSNSEKEETSKNTGDDLNKIKDLIKSYSEKNKSDGTVKSGETGDNYDENHTNVIQDVYTNEDKPKSTYDELFSKYISSKDYQSNNKTDITYNKYLISVFKGATATDDKEIENSIESQINSVLEQVNKLYNYSEECRNEYAEISSTGVISQINTPVAQRTISVKLYTVLSMAAVFAMLCVAVPVLIIFKKNVKNPRLIE